MPSPENLVHQTSTSTGTGPYTLAPVAGALGKQDFAEAFGTGGTDVFDVFIMNREVKEWLVGKGHMSDASTLVVDTVADNHLGTTAPVNFSAGTKDVTNDVTAANALTVDMGFLGRRVFLDADRDTYLDASTDDVLDVFVGGASVTATTPTLHSVLVDLDAKGAMDAQAGTALSGDLSPAALTGNVNDYDPPGLPIATVLRLNSNGAYDITGIAGGSDGRILILHNISPYTLYFPSESTNSTITNRFRFDFDEKHVHPNACLVMQYDATTQRWRSVAVSNSEPKTIMVACSDETSDLATGSAVITFRIPTKMKLFTGQNGARANVNTAPTGSGITVDINRNGTTILSTKLTIDAGDRTSVGAAIPPVISFTDLGSDDEITVDIDAVGSTTPGKGLKVSLIGVCN